MAIITLKSKVLDRMTPEEFAAFCLEQREQRIERTAQGEIIIMPPTYSKTGRNSLELAAQLTIWNKQTRLGETFDSSTGFTLPNGAVRSPDAAWIARERWEALTEAQKESFAPICPDFVIELRSSTDSLTELEEKMEEWITNGCQLGWLIDAKKQKATVFRANGSRETVTGWKGTLSGELVLPGFELQLKELKA